MVWRHFKESPFRVGGEDKKLEEFSPPSLPDLNIFKDLDNKKVAEIIFETPVENHPDNKKTIEFDPIDLKETTTSFSPIEIIPAVGTAIDIGKKIVEFVSSSNDEIKQEKTQESEGFRLNTLPRHADDFATRWYYSQQDELVAERVKVELNAALQILEELNEEKLELPDGFKGKNIAKDLEKFILADFEKECVLYNGNNLAHRAFYAHCTKRAIDSIRQGTFIGPEGYERKYPEVADAIEERYNKIVFENLIKPPRIE